jgi:molecular chaperone GrpE (heat shock protein)
MILQTEMEALRAEPILEGDRYASIQCAGRVEGSLSAQLQPILDEFGLQTPTSSKSGSSHESELREQVAAEVTTAVQGELDDIRKKIQDAEEERSRTQRELEEYKKITEQNTKEMVETNLLIKKLLSLQGNASSST